MESDDDLHFSPSQEASSPFPQRKLKRLKKAPRVSTDPLVQPIDHSQTISEFDSINAVHIESSKTLDYGESVDPVLIPSVSISDAFNDGRDPNVEFNGLPVDHQARGALDAEEVQIDDLGYVAGEFDGKGDDRSMELGAESMDLDMETFAKKRRNSEGLKEKKDKKRVKSHGDDGKPKGSARTKRRDEKERKSHLEQLHAESQRLLRETRDAAFKPVPLVQKPISSILEKIRQRKLEFSKKACTLKGNYCIADKKSSTGEILPDLYPEHIKSDEKGNDKYEEVVTDVLHDNAENNLDASYEDGSGETATLSVQHENIISPMAPDEESKHAFRTPINDTQDIFCDSQTSDEGDGLPKVQPNNSPEEVLAPSLLTMNLMLDSAPPDDDSSDEEDDDKENIVPHPQKLVSEGLFLKGDPVKAFVDDEAIEEDDSDNDPLRFQDNEDDDENGDAEELKDLIATGYEENAIDSERRDALHQQWLEQQDAAATDNVLQKLKCGWKQRDPTMLEDEEEDGEFGEEYFDEVADDLVLTNVARINSKKMKQMIPQMFTDKDDAFLSSDDEETEQRLVRQRLLEKTEEQASLLSPAEDESSREVFGLIKKLNIAPDIKKKAKTSLFDMLITGGNSNSSSKSSFLGRASGNSLPSSHKHGSSTVRSFIFGRDDSNSRSAVSTSEVSSDMSQIENRPKRNPSVKFSSSQSKSNSQNTKNAAETVSGSSLFEILRRSSMQSKQSTQKNMVGQTQTVFSAFKSGKKLIKIEGRT
ncbi:hypothetical protein HHK36_008495 [Tetracentron sinense]|uniref:DNA replication checkpoint mediator MRC1 domain-containing protein n=1 Tax=Tetracentron sinense TaxID=13715 RepID=A0A835DK03_TETSI|nr:hypothetical protein HHK36_008495 [Tetracentron sinense]